MGCSFGALDECIAHPQQPHTGLLGMSNGAKGTSKQTIKPYTSIRLDDLLDLSRTPGAVCQSIQRRNAPEVDAACEVWLLSSSAASKYPYAVLCLVYMLLGRSSH